MELKQGWEYIVKNRSGLSSKIIKIMVVVELTATSILWKNVDRGFAPEREELSKFKNDNSLLEEIEPTFSLKSLHSKTSATTL
jgi:hypothetical protein